MTLQFTEAKESVNTSKRRTSILQCCARVILSNFAFKTIFFIASPYRQKPKAISIPNTMRTKEERGHASDILLSLYYIAYEIQIHVFFC